MPKMKRRQHWAVLGKECSKCKGGGGNESRSRRGREGPQGGRQVEKLGWQGSAMEKNVLLKDFKQESNMI